MARRTNGKSNADVVIVGGGIMGCACAWQLARLGAKVVVLERSVPGAEASSAAAGILGAQIEAHGPGPTADLALLSRARYGRFAALLEEATGIDVGYRECGLIQVAFDAAQARKFAQTAAWQRRRKLDVKTLDGNGARKLEPALSERVAGGVRFAGDGRVDPPLLLRALHIAAQRAGAEFRSGAYVRKVLVEAGRACGVAFDNGTIGGAHVVVAAGSWTTLVGGIGLPPEAVVPVRGQMVELFSDLPLLEHVVFGPGCYLVPRDDGRTLVGSTMEFVGYQREVTAGAVRDLLGAAIDLAPKLKDASLRSTWSNFRPFTGDDRPLIGPSPVPGVTLATGHYRSGILLAPITAEIVAAVVMGKRPPLSLEPFSVRQDLHR